MTQTLSLDNVQPAAAGASVTRIGRWILLALALVSVGVYANSLVNGFALDDVAIVEHNDNVNSLEWTRIWTENYWPKQEGSAPDILYRPLTLWSYLATHALAPGALWTYHLGNVLLHALVTVMSAILAWRIFGNRWVAALAGLLFALHPLHTEVVANVVGRAELLSTVFSLAALLVFLPDGPLLLERGPAKRSYWHGWLVAMCFLAAMLSKETPAALLGGFVFIDFWRWSRWERGTRPTLMRWLGRQTWRYYVPQGVVFGIYLAMRINACGLMRDIATIHPIVNPLVTATPLERLVTPFAILTKYLHLTFWPRVLSADYSYPSFLPTANPLAAGPLIGILLTILAGIGCVKFWRKAPHVVLTIVLFACSYALAANFLRIGTIMGERLFYLPSLFVIMVVSWAAVGVYGWAGAGRRDEKIERGASPAANRGRRWVAIGLVSATCVAMTWRTVVRNTDWHDNIPLAIATARDNPQSAKACYWAGNILASNATEKWMKEFGSVVLKRATELYPEYGLAYFELAKYEGRNQHLGKSLIYLAQAAEWAPGVNDIRAGLMAIKTDLRIASTESYMPELEEFKAAHREDPAGSLALAVALAAQGKLDEGEKACTDALAINGHFHEAACELALIRFNNGQEERAIAVLAQYVDHVGNNLESRCLLADALMRLDHKKYPRALAEAKKCLDQADVINTGNPRVRDLRGELARKMAAAKALTPEVAGRAVSLAPEGGRP
jgi:protein O-mannosyl-transferase